MEIIKRYWYYYVRRETSLFCADAPDPKAAKWITNRGIYRITRWFPMAQQISADGSKGIPGWEAWGKQLKLKRR